MGFFEILLVAVIALIVLGPAELVKIAQVLGRWFGHARKNLSEIQKQINLDDKAKDSDKHD